MVLDVRKRFIRHSNEKKQFLKDYKYSVDKLTNHLYASKDVKKPCSKKIKSLFRKLS